MEFFKKNKILFFLLILACACLYFSCGSISNIRLDIGRELYYPLAILDGKILFKDLFCIYGPFSYLVNALVYKLLGIKLSSLYLTGSICAILTIFLTYKIAKNFLSEFASFSITVFVILTGCLSTRIFNFTLPYSYAALYGLLCVLLSLYFIILYDKNKNHYLLILSSIFAGFAASNKYDYFLYFFPLFIYIFKKSDIKLFIKCIFSYFISLFIPYAILFLQGLKIDEFINNFKMIKEFALTDTMKTFYLTQGVYYTNKLWIDWFYKIIFFIIDSLIIISGFKLYKKIKPAGILLIALGSIVPFLFIRETSYLFISFLVLILLLFNFSKNSFLEKIIIASSVLISLKSLWGISHTNYGLYYIPLIFTSFLILVSKFNSKILLNTVCIILISASLNFGLLNFQELKFQNAPIKTTKGTVKITNGHNEAIISMIDFINGLEEENPYIMIFPEGLFFNFMADKKTKINGVYNSLIPLYTEGEQEDRIIENYKTDSPKYIVFWSYDMPEYSKGSICDTYAEKFCSFVYDNYQPYKKISFNKDNFFIFRLK